MWPSPHPTPLTKYVSVSHKFFAQPVTVFQKADNSGGSKPSDKGGGDRSSRPWDKGGRSKIKRVPPRAPPLDNAIHYIDLYPVDNANGFPDTFAGQWFIRWIALSNVMDAHGLESIKYEAVKL